MAIEDPFGQTWKWKARLEARRVLQMLRFARWSRADLPVVFGNAMAKSGSHVLSQFLEGVCEVTPLVFAYHDPVRTRLPDGARPAASTVLAALARLRPGDIGWGYLPSQPEYLEALNRASWKNLFIYRDPRDRMVSQIFYATDIHKGHGLRQHLRALDSMEARIDAVTRGIPGLVKNVREIYDSYAGWLTHPRVLAIRFEDFAGQREATLGRLIDYLEEGQPLLRISRAEAKARINHAMSPVRSPTYRSGKSGGWREHFTPANKASFKQVAGDLLKNLGYEKDDGW